MNRWLCVLGALVLLALPAAVYQPSLGGGFIWDDDAHVTDNPTIQDPGGLPRIWLEPGSVPQYYPVTHSAFWAQWQLWGDWATGYRLVNVCLHGLSCLLVWLVLCRLKVPGAWFVGAVFAVHPVYVESVAWVSELKNVLSGVLYLGALALYLMFASPLDQPAAERRRWWLYALAMAVFLLALLAKTVTCTLPAVILLLLWWKRPRLTGRDLGPLAPMFVLGVGLGLVTVLMEKHFVGAQGAQFDFSPVDRVLIAGRALWFYAGKVFWPWEQIFFYPRWAIDPTALWQYVYPLSALAVMASLYLLHHRLGKGPLVAVLFFAGTLTPALGFFDVYPFVFSFVADHFQYLASLGMVALGVGVVAHGVQGRPRARRVALTVGLVVLAGLATLSWRYSAVFVGLEPLYQDVIAKNPRAWAAMNNLGTHYIKQGRWDDAQAIITQALEVNPANDRAYNNMALIHAHQGRRMDAIDQYVRSLRINANDPQTHLALGALLMQERRYDLAEQYLGNAVRLDPTLVEARVMLALAWVHLGRLREAHTALEEALAMDPQSAQAHAAQGELLVAQKRVKQAIAAFRASLKLDDDQPEVHNNLGALLAQINQHKAAVPHYEAALKARPRFAIARHNMAESLLRLRQADAAAEHYRKLLADDPADVAARVALADLDTAANRLDDAVAGYRKVIETASKDDPLSAIAHGNLGAIHLMRRQDDLAREHLDAALRIDPKLVDAWFNLGVLHVGRKEHDAAGKAFEAVLKLQPRHASAAYQMGMLHEQAGRWPQALASYRQVIELRPKSAESLRRLAWVLAVSPDPKVRDAHEALARATEASKLYKERNAAALDVLAVAQAGIGAYDDAIKTATQAAKLAHAAKQVGLARQIEARLKLYQAGQPFTQPATP